MPFRTLEDTIDVTADDPGVPITLTRIGDTHGSHVGLNLVIRNTTGGEDVYVTRPDHDDVSAQKIAPGATAEVGPILWYGTAATGLELWSANAALCKVDPWYTGSIDFP